MNFLDKIQMAKAFFGLVEDPTQTHHVFTIGRIGMKNADSPGFRRMLAHIYADQEFQKQFEAQYMPPPVDLQALAQLPEGTLGREYFRHMDENKLDPNFFPKEDTTVPLKYAVMRLRYAHDIWHVLAGHDTSFRGEICLQAFYLAQTRSGISTVLMGAGFLHGLKQENADSGLYMETIYAAYELGKRAKSLLSLKFETLWERNLAELRTELGIELLPAAPVYQ